MRRQASRLNELLVAGGIGIDSPVAFVPRNRPSSVAALLGLLAAGRTVQMMLSTPGPEDSTTTRPLSPVRREPTSAESSSSADECDECGGGGVIEPT